MKNKRVSLIQVSNKVFDDYQLQGLVYPPLWALTLLSQIKHEHQDIDLELYDLKLGQQEISYADVFALSGMNQDLKVLLELRSELSEKYPNSLIILGGPITWSFEMEKQLDLLKEFDYLFIGDGEEEFVKFIKRFNEDNLKSIPRIIHSSKKFDINESLPFNFSFLEKYRGQYSGGNIEVSRGCPFQCEFCDIRVMPDNNKAHCRNIDAIIEDLKGFHNLGMKFVFLACDNFNANARWAEELCDRIIEWRRESGSKISFYTWVTINICYHPRLLKKMRLIGLDTLFVGVESFHHNSLLETTKIQNVRINLVDAIKKIQGYGFIVFAGLILGFDSEPEDIAKIQLEGIMDSGLISGDVTPLIALPGTPLHKRLKETGRVRDNHKTSLGFSRYSSNIIFNRSTEQFRKSLLDFFAVYNSGSFQRKRLLNFYALLNSENYVAVCNEDYASFGILLKIIKRNPIILWKNVYRLLLIAKSPERLFNAIWALVHTLYSSFNGINKMPYFKFWLFAWTTVLLKSDGVREDELDLLGNDEQSAKPLVATQVTRNSEVSSLYQ